MPEIGAAAGGLPARTHLPRRSFPPTRSSAAPASTFRSCRTDRAGTCQVLDGLRRPNENAFAGGTADGHVIASGVASPSAHGQATRARLTADTKPQGHRVCGPKEPQPRNVATAVTSTAGTNQAAIASARFLERSPSAMGLANSRVIRLRANRQPPRGVASMTIAPLPLMLPPSTRSPRLLGEQPVVHLSAAIFVARRRAFPHHAVPGRRPTGFTRRRSPTATMASGIVSGVSSDACARGRCARPWAARDHERTDRRGRAATGTGFEHCPSSTSTTIMPPTHKTPALRPSASRKASGMTEGRARRRCSRFHAEHAQR